MSRSLRPAVAVVGALACLALPASALAKGDPPPNLTCTATGSTTVYSGTYSNVTVPPGQTCYLSDATVLGNVVVESTANLDLQNSGSVGGSLLVGSQASAFEDTGWVINGPTAGNGAETLTITGTTHSIVVNDTQVLSIGSATIDGSIVSNDGVFGGSISSSIVHGNVLVNGTTGFEGTGGTWLIAGPQLNGNPQQIDGNLVLTNNQATIYAFENNINQNLVCEGNNPPPITEIGTEGNTVGGSSIGQCATPNSGDTSAAVAAARAGSAAHAATNALQAAH